MALDYTKTASPCAITKILAPHVHGHLWHDGRQWYTRQPDNTWHSGSHSGHTRYIKAQARAFPYDSYYARAFNRITTDYGAREYLEYLRLAAKYCILLKPADLDRPWLGERTIFDCLCQDEQCRYPEPPLIF